MSATKSVAPGNRTLRCTLEEQQRLAADIVNIDRPASIAEIRDKIIAGDMLTLAGKLPLDFVDLLILDPPYNLSKNYNGFVFSQKQQQAYQQWFQQIIAALLPTLKPTATVYVCADWKTSLLMAPILQHTFHVRNRITWEREKGRGAAANWKNNAEDVWFCTVSEDYYFDANAVKLKRKVLAPYKVNGQPKDWQAEASGNYRLTHPSNLWTDITIPFWSMPENTQHPTQKPEKLMAKLILASSPPGGWVLDPFVGSGTSAVVAKKLGRTFCGIELNQEYCCWALKRLEQAAVDSTIQGYANGTFWERNAAARLAKNRTQTA